ncbi:MAG: ribosomal L7Ae/L30e/S12e/Gadd45 family protein [Lachnospiraceae bacterium]|nr:ribosomal L7Ae/L30e/S12e/Gadd45 family protein [Lachnospiraceae bacterium]
MQDKVLSLLGLAKRAGKLASGGYAAEQSIKCGRSRLVIISRDTSDASKKHYNDMCSYRGIPVAEYSDKEALGHFTGSEMRSVLSVEDEGFAGKLLELMK